MNTEITQTDAPASQAEELSLEERLAAIQAAVAQNLAASGVQEDEEGYGCPVDPAEREMCDSCQ